MAKNDAILIDGIIQEKMAAELLDRGEAFELFAFEQILKSYDLTRDEIESGWVDGQNDGGIDGFFTFVNGVLVQKIEGQTWPKKNVSIDFWILSCKHHDTFKQEPINTLFPTIEELLDFTKKPTDFTGKYSSELIQAREVAATVFMRTAASLPEVNFHFAYASRGDYSELGANIEARSNQVKRIVSDYFSNADVTFEYVGAAELIELSRKHRTVLPLPYSQQLAGEKGAFVLLVPIDAYAKFISDEHGNLRRYLFDSNVRDFLGNNRVNLDIQASLSDEQSPDFWWLNNGVTILATSAIPIGVTSAGKAIQLQDVQIVNGLQTSQTIHNFFRLGTHTPDIRSVLIKIIVSDDSEVRDKIIQATNNQSPVELAALSATDKIQRDIEQILERSNWYYERRKNYYKNIGKPIERFVTPLFLAVAYIAIAKKSPQKAGMLKTRFMRNLASYEAVFSDQVPIELWPVLTRILKAVEAGMVSDIPNAKATGERLIGRWRGAVALCSLARIHGTFNYTLQSLMTTNIELLTADYVKEVFATLRGTRDFANASEDEATKKLLSNGFNMNAACRIFSRAHGLNGIDVIGKWQLPAADSESSKTKDEVVKTSMLRALTELVDGALPPQPWKPGMHKVVASTLGIKLRIVRKVTQLLIEDGRRHNQRDGIVFDNDKKIIAIDPDRDIRGYQVGDIYKGDE